MEDEAKLRQLLRDMLEREGLAVVTTGSGAEAIEVASRIVPDLVVLDLGLPDIAGEDVAREIRRRTETPILMLTAKVAEEDRIRGLELGADDYMTKPFSPREFVLRVQAVLRRTRVQVFDDGPMSFGHHEVEIDEDRHEVRVRGETVELTPTEWGLLVALGTTPGRVYSRYELINRVRGYEFEGYERTIDSHVKNLRHKIEREPSDPVIVETVLGVGYRLGLARDA
ncbi:MAG: response regulator transcription factor [Acidimicrobiales bacterium]